MLLVHLIREYFEYVKEFKKNKLIMIVVSLFYLISVGKLSDMGMIRPFMTEKNLTELELSEGTCKIYHGGKFKDVYLDTSKIDYFQFDLCIPFIDEDTLNGQHLKIWHKGRIVYQLERNGEIVFDVNHANSNIRRYNLLVVPSGYFTTFVVFFYISLLLISLNQK